MACQAPAQAAAVHSGYGNLENQTTRKTLIVALSEAIKAEITQGLLAHIPGFTALGGVPVSVCQELSLLRYRQGHFFKAHRDTFSHLPQGLSQRRISVIVFLNSPAGTPAYSGGELMLYAFPGSKPGRMIGLPLEVTPGLMIAFPSDLMHEVRPVTEGERFSLVSWFV
ncbi:MAG: 2OG-Fe(II) oxygenase [Candidatus Sericytochromatia bacterium]